MWLKRTRNGVGKSAEIDRRSHQREFCSNPPVEKGNVSWGVNMVEAEKLEFGHLFNLLRMIL